MIQVETNSIQKYLCGLKVGIVILIVFVILGESWLSIIILLIVGLGVVFLENKKIFKLDSNKFEIYRGENIWEGERLIYNIEFTNISKVILKSPAIYCMSKIVIECDHKRCCTINGFELSKDDFQQLLNVLKKNAIFEVKVI